MFQAYFTMTFRLIRTETSPVTTITGTFSIVNKNCLQNVHKGHLISLEIRSVILCLFDSSSCFNDEIDAFIWYFKLRPDQTNLNKHLTTRFNGQRLLGINNTNRMFF